MTVDATDGMVTYTMFPIWNIHQGYIWKKFHTKKWICPLVSTAPCIHALHVVQKSLWQWLWRTEQWRTQSAISKISWGLQNWNNATPNSDIFFWYDMHKWFIMHLWNLLLKNVNKIVKNVGGATIFGQEQDLEYSYPYTTIWTQSKQNCARCSADKLNLCGRGGRGGRGRGRTVANPKYPGGYN